jgi:adenine-specific DNA-methyltransferase
MTKATTVQPEKLDLRSHDIAADKLAELLRLFPEIRTEGGKLDFDRLKLALGQSVDVGKERYGMNWPGKAECFKTIQAPSVGTLLPCPEESVNFDTTENLIIEGDNLEVLKLLQKSYLGKVKMIYIDPPYNTGNDFIYPDNFTESLQTYLEYTGQVDAEGKKFGTNTEADGRFHSKWLNMMYPRLYLARNLLSDDGIVCVSVDDTEFTNLRSILNEVFGEDGLISTIVIQSNKRGQTYKEIAKTHEYLVIYSRDPDVELFELEKDGDALPYRDAKGAFDLWELRNRNPKFGRHNRPNLYFPIYVAPSNKDDSGYCLVSLERTATFSVEVFPKNSSGEDSCWRWSKEKLRTVELTGSCPVVVAKQKRDGEWNIYEKSRKSTTKAKSIWTETDVISEQGTVELGQLGLAGYFDHPKPVGLLKKCIQVCAGDDGIILDFFAGSGTTGHAILELNEHDAGNRRFILVQLPEPTSHKEYPTIASICEERVRRVIKNLNEEDSGTLNMDGGKKPDRGFRVFKLAESNFTTWDAQVPHEERTLLAQLEEHVEHIREGRTPDDILYELLLKSGFPLTTPVEKQTLAGKTIYSVAGGALIICLEPELTLELIRAIAALKPERVVCLDEGFAGNDQLKANAVQTFKTKGVTSFKTV